MLNRRSLLKAGAAAGVLAAVPAGLVLGAQPKRTVDATTPFTVPLKVSPPLRPVRLADYDLYRLTTREADVEILPGTTSTVRTFNGALSPLIVARRGRPVVIEQANALNVPFSMHLHGGHVPAHSDGHPKNEVAPGKSRLFHYPNSQLASTMWVHDHSHHAHAENIYRGAAATYVLTDPEEDRLPLPKGQYDVTLQLRDARIEDNGTLVYDLHGFQERPTFLVNGSPRPYFRVAARKYRFRLVNTSNERAFVLRLGEGDEFTHIATDGGLLPAPVPSRILQLWPAERQEIVVDFSKYPVGSKIVLQTMMTYPGEAPEVMRFDVVRGADDPSSVPGRLRPVADLGTPTVERQFAMSFDPQSQQHLINGKPFDINRVDFRPKLGTTEIWTIENKDVAFTIPHSLHPHLDHFQVVERNGKPAGPSEAGLKDTVSVMPGESARIKIKFTEYTGMFMFHCHLMGHLTMGMMGQMEMVH
ncbi:multicopper oxidase family protein [Streptomyces sp. NBC_01210]|uniref:multicopper oxidase family protein n=1 Tax=Streptomyces sp. NBC_01210 TaxID=2903774 RepID=UPI002E13C086|nr:multicopper oxidase family protein [Streptomyces sp. NBC_01210]